MCLRMTPAKDFVLILVLGGDGVGRTPALNICNMCCLIFPTVQHFLAENNTTDD